MPPPDDVVTGGSSQAVNPVTAAVGVAAGGTGQPSQTHRESGGSEMQQQRQQMQQQQMQGHAQTSMRHEAPMVPPNMQQPPPVQQHHLPQQQQQQQLVQHASSSMQMARPTGASTSVGQPGIAAISLAAPLSPLHDLSGLSASELAYCQPLLHESYLRHARHQHAEVLAVLDRLLAMVPNLVPAWTGKGVAFKCLKDNVAAVQCFQRALQLDPTDWSAHDQLGLIFKETELFEKGTHRRQQGSTRGMRWPISVQ